MPELDLARITRYCDDRVPVRHRDQVRVELRVRGRAVTLFECRPPWHPGLSDWSRSKVAQLRYDPEKCRWTLYCADRHGRWHRYEDVDPAPVGELLAEVTEDPTGIFWG